MIGVISRSDQAGVPEEFFELFKTPWESYRTGQRYDVVLVTAEEAPHIDAPLTVVYGPSAKTVDSAAGYRVQGRRTGAVLAEQDGDCPIYGELSTFSQGENAAICCKTADGEIAAIRSGPPERLLIRVGYDLFDEVRHLLSTGQTIEHAPIPALDLHIGMLRRWILESGLGLVEIPPTPANHSFSVCLTHDIDFVGIRRHRLDHSMWGFVYRATIGSLRNLIRGRLSLQQVLRNWMAAASLPLVYAGWAPDFWEPFEWYLEAEKGLPATYFLIPFKRRAGEKVSGPKASLRGTAYDASDITTEAALLLRNGCEIGVHGIDSWHDADQGRAEIGAVARVTGQQVTGIRMHWLLRDAQTPSVLERAGYVYDSTFGFNETVGYRAGTGQVFRPLGAQTLLELPMHIQDGALFYPQRLDLPETEAETLCLKLMENAGRFGGVLTILWHDRSHGPERFWGGFYQKLVQTLRGSDAWFGTAGQVVGWFQQRRAVRFVINHAAGNENVGVRWEGGTVDPALKVRIYGPKSLGSQSAEKGDFVDLLWDGTSTEELERQINTRLSAGCRSVALGSLT